MLNSDIIPALETIPRIFWLESEPDGTVYLWTGITLSNGNRRSHGAPITSEQMRSLFDDLSVALQQSSPVAA